MQISIEGHLAAECGWDTPRGYQASFANLSRHGAITDEGLAVRLVVHRYWRVDVAEVHRILHDNLAGRQLRFRTTRRATQPAETGPPDRSGGSKPTSW